MGKMGNKLTKKMTVEDKNYYTEIFVVLWDSTNSNILCHCEGPDYFFTSSTLHLGITFKRVRLN